MHVETMTNKQAADMGTRLHAWAAETIKLGIKQPKTKKTLYMYVNDAIGYKMSTEVVLYYSPRFFGTADSIAFRNNTLRIHDLKTGKSPVHPEQLIVYAALFCLEYKIKPSDIDIELRFYQNNDIFIVEHTVDDIVHAMDRIVYFDKMFEKFDLEEA